MPEKIDVLLVSPGHPKRVFQGLADEFTSVEPPVFCGLFATYLRGKRLSVAIYDPVVEGDAPAEAAFKIAGLYTPTLIVLVVYGAQPSASTQNMTAAEELTCELKEQDFKEPTKIMMTGPHPAALPLRTMRDNPDVDFICSREGPVTILKTWSVMTAGSGDGGNFSAVPSLWWRDEEAQQIVPPSLEEPLLDDLDSEMSGIAWDLMAPMSKYRSHNWHSFDHINNRSPYAAIHTSLGCPYKCSFCMINSPFGKPAYRMWSAKVVVEELSILAGIYNVVNVKFVDEMFVLNPSHVLDLCQKIKAAGIKVNIWAYARVDTVQDRFLGALKDAGVNWLCLGIESASQYVRDGAEKKYGNEEIISTVRRIQDAGIYVIGNYIFGLPDDTSERMKETLDLAMELRCEYANFYSAMAYPGSPLYTQAVKEGRQLPEKWEDYSQHGYGCFPLANEFCTSAEVLAFRDVAFNRYFTDASYLVKVKSQFGQEVADHIWRMVKIPLKRKILGD